MIVNEAQLSETMEERNTDQHVLESREFYKSDAIRAKGMPFNFIIGGRGIGKTFDFITWLLEENIFHCYLRRTQTEIDLGCNKEINPYTVPAESEKIVVEIESSKNITYIYREIEATNVTEEGTEKSKRKMLAGYAIALSTFSNVRGGDFSNVDVIIFDEFIKENTKKNTIKDEAGAFFNLYESINRNREFFGKPPVQVYFLSNAVSIISDIIVTLGLVGDLEMMIRKEQRFRTIPERGICIEIPAVDSFTDQKKKTALYRLTAGTRFYEHAVENKFAYDSWYHVEKKNISEFIPLCGVLDIFFFSHKSGGYVYACESRADAIRYTEDEISIFKRNHYFYLREQYMSGHMFYSNMTVKEIVRQLLT